MKNAATVRRGIYSSSEKATLDFERSRNNISILLRSKEESIIFINNIEDVKKIWNVKLIKGPFNSINDIKQSIIASEKDKLIMVDCSTFMHKISDIRDEISASIYFDGSYVGMPGIAVISLNDKYLKALEPFEFGGDMIKSVTLKGSIYDDAPHKFSAGTPNIMSVIGLGEAISDFNVSKEKIEDISKQLFDVLNKKKISFKYYKLSNCFELLSNDCIKSIGFNTIYVPRKNSQNVLMFINKYL